MQNSFVDLSVCAIMKNEGPYVKEWIDYHRLVGVKRFYIYDNESEDNLKEILQKYIDEGIVVYKYFPGEARQMPAYEDFFKNHADETEWVAIIDGDEFIVPVKKRTIPKILKGYKKFPGLVVNWQLFDCNGHEKKPKGGVMENYTRVHFYDTDETMLIKSIVQPTAVASMPNPHFCFYKENKLAVDENKKPFQYWRSDIVHWDKIKIHHYWSKSYEEYMKKINRGRAGHKKGIKRPVIKTDYEYENTKYNYSMYKYVVRLDRKKFLKETIRYIWLNILNIFIWFKYLFKKNPVYEYLDPKWYFKTYPDAKKSGLSALEHFYTIGWKKGYNPGPHFDTNYYFEVNPDVFQAKLNPLFHYIKAGKQEKRKIRDVL